MSDDSVICAGRSNTTDCLLRMLISTVGSQGDTTDAGSEWEPISFGFTAPVGVLAAIFTLITVIQTILAAGPGRRRSSKHIIGKWSSKRETYWSWSELRLLTVAPTPVLKIFELKQTLRFMTNVQQSLEIDTEAGELNKKPVTGNFRVIFRHVKRAASDFFAMLRRLKRPASRLAIAKTTQESRARWLTHIDELGLEDLIFDRGDSEKTAADYLPDDLRAVPAYAEVGCIIGLAAAAGLSSIREIGPQNPYPVVIGKGFQLDFRDHPLLGSIGVFSMHGRRTDQRAPRSKEDILAAVCHAEGVVQAKGAWFISSRESYSSAHPCRPRCGCGGDPRELLCSAHALYHEKHKNVLWILAADTPKTPPAIFPSRSVNLHHILTAFVMQSRCLAGERGPQRQDDIHSIFPIQCGTIRIWWIDDRVIDNPSENGAHENVSSYLTTSPKKEPSADDYFLSHPFLLQSWICGIFTEVVELSLKFVHDFDHFQSWWDALSEEKADEFRLMVLVQIQQLDKLLGVIQPGLLDCRKAILYLTTQAFLNVQVETENRELNTKVFTDRWNASNPPKEMLEKPRSHVFHGHVETLKSLDTLRLPQQPLCPELEQEFTRQHNTLRTTIAPRLCYSQKAEGPAEEAIFQRLLGMVDIYKVSEGLAESQVVPEEGPKANGEEITDNIIIWRIVLMGVLFWTAPDNSDILNSGLWGHIIPLL